MANIPLLQSSKVIIGDFDTSVASLGEILGLKSGTLVNCGVSYLLVFPKNLAFQ